MTPKFQQASHVVVSEIDDEVMLMNPDSNETFGMDVRGSLIWNLIAEPQTVDHVVSKLIQRFAVDELDCRRDVEKFFELLGAKGLVSVET